MCKQKQTLLLHKSNFLLSSLGLPRDVEGICHQIQAYRHPVNSRFGNITKALRAGRVGRSFTERAVGAEPWGRCPGPGQDCYRRQWTRNTAQHVGQTVRSTDNRFFEEMERKSSEGKLGFNCRKLQGACEKPCTWRRAPGTEHLWAGEAQDGLGEEPGHIQGSAMWGAAVEHV